MRSANVRALAIMIAATSVLATAACSKKSETTATPEPPASSSVAEPVASAAPSSSVNPHMLRSFGRLARNHEDGPQITFEAPAAFTVVPNPSPMRKATYTFAKVAGDTDDAELAVSQALGGVDANVERWGKQFGDAKPKTEKKTINGLPVTMVEIKGTYAGGGPMMGMTRTKPEPKEKYMLLGAIVDQGEQQHFFKMLGPEKTVTAAKKDFDKLVSTVRAKPDAGASDAEAPAPAASTK